MSLKLPIYMDYNATTPVDPRVREAMEPYFTEVFGNAASKTHPFGWKAADAVDRAGKQIAELIGASSRELVYTAGATESNNLALKGAVETYAEKGNHIITCQTEHMGVMSVCRALEQQGCEVTYLAPDEFGCVSPAQVEEAITDRTVVITLMAANNETGTLHPLAEIGEVAKRRGVLLHSDATQAVGKIPVDVRELGVDLMSFSGHKLYAPKGIGGLYIRRRDPRVRLAPQTHGGGQQRNIRSGTLNVPGIVGLGEACRIAGEEMPRECARMAKLRDALEQGILRQVAYVRRNGHPQNRLPNTSNLSFGFVEGEALLLKIRDIAVSSGSACSSDKLEPSPVLTAMGLPDAVAHGSVRFSLGRFSSAGEVDFAVGRVVRAVEELREMSPLYEQALKEGRTDVVEWTKPGGPAAGSAMPGLLRETFQKSPRP